MCGGNSTNAASTRENRGKTVFDAIAIFLTLLWLNANDFIVIGVKNSLNTVFSNLKKVIPVERFLCDVRLYIHEQIQTKLKELSFINFNLKLYGNHVKGVDLEIVTTMEHFLKRICRQYCFKWCVLAAIDCRFINQMEKN